MKVQKKYFVIGTFLAKGANAKQVEGGLEIPPPADQKPVQYDAEAEMIATKLLEAEPTIESLELLSMRVGCTWVRAIEGGAVN